MAAAVALHALLLTLLGLGVDHGSAPKPAPALEIALVRPAPKRADASRPTTVGESTAPSSTVLSPTQPAAEPASKTRAAEAPRGRPAAAVPAPVAPMAGTAGGGGADGRVPDARGPAAAGVGADGDALRAIAALFACHGGGGDLDPASRARCEAGRLRAAREAPRVDGVPAEKRAYYDQVAAAYARMHEGAPVALTPPIGGRYSNLGVDERWVGAAGAHPPGIGCKVVFGRPRGSKSYHDAPPHSLKLGVLPCFITPPSGLFTEEADVGPPASLRERTDDAAQAARYAPPPKD